MALINQNSIIGLTSITSPSASNVLTVHTNDTTERLRVSTSGLSFSGTNASLDTSGNLTVGGNVSIGGTLTYEDVTNIDSVGVVTARSGIHVTGGSVGIGTDNPVEKLSVEDSSPAVLINATSGSGESKLQFGRVGNTNIGEIKYEHSNNALSFRTNDVADRLRIDSSGRLLLGTTSLISSSVAANFQVASDFGPRFNIARSDTTTAADNLIGAFDFYGNDSNGTYQNCARILAEADLDHGTDDKPTRLTFYTTPDGSATPTERLRIDSSGRMLLRGAVAGSNGTADDLVVANNASASDQAGITIRGGTSGRSQIFFSDGTSGESEYIGMLRYDHSENSMQFRTAATERLRISSDGNVNIGNKNHLSHHSTVDSLQIGYALNLYEDSYTSGTDNYVVLGNNVHYNSGNKYMRDDQASRIMMQAGTFYFQSAATGTAGNAISFTDVLRITSSGKIGLDGMTNPVAKLHIGTEDDSALTAQTLFVEGAKTGFASYTGLPQNQLCLYDNTASTAGSGGAIGFAANCGGSQQTWIAAMESQRDSSTNDASNYAGSLVFWTRPAQSTPTEKLRIKSTGEIKIPGSSGSMLTINESNPSGNFYQEISYAPSSKGCLYLANFAYYSSQPALVINDKDTNNARVMEDVQFQRNGSMKGYIRINPGSVTYSTSSSDIRTKKNFEDWTEDNLSKFKTLSPKLFNWIEEDDGSEKTKGFIAQDNLEKFPEAYPLTASTDRYAFNPSGMVAYLMKALQESALKIETLEGRLDAAGL
jgi:hypothetical protein